MAIAGVVELVGSRQVEPHPTRVKHRQAPMRPSMPHAYENTKGARLGNSNLSRLGRKVCLISLMIRQVREVDLAILYCTVSRCVALHKFSLRV